MPHDEITKIATPLLISTDIYIICKCILKTITSGCHFPYIGPPGARATNK